MVPKVPKVQAGDHGLDAYRESLRLHEHSLRNRQFREFYRKDLTTRANLYGTLAQKRGPGSEEAAFFLKLSKLHWEELTRFGHEDDPKPRKPKTTSSVPLVYPDIPDQLSYRLHFIETGSLKREKAAVLAAYADYVHRQHAQNGDVLLSVAVTPAKVQLFERIVEAIGDRIGLRAQKAGGFRGWVAADGTQHEDPSFKDPTSPWTKVSADNFQARFYNWTVRRALGDKAALPTDIPPMPNSRPWDPDERFREIQRHTQADQLNEAMSLIERLPPGDRELVFDEVIYLRYVLDQPVRGDDVRYLVRRYISSSTISARLAENFERYLELVDAQLQEAGPTPDKFPGLSDMTWIRENDPNPLVRETPPLKDWKATKTHYYRCFEAYGGPSRPRGRIFVWNPDIASSSISWVRSAFAPQFVAAEEAFRRENGIPEIGKGWVSEVSLFTLVRSLFPDAIHQWRPVFLGLQSVDIYVPSRKLAIEYQGAQHYGPVALFGGD